MTEELERLGGGDTRVGKAAICCCVASTATFGHGQSILKATSGGITVTDPRSAASTSCPKSKSFSVPCCLQSEASGSMVCNSLGQVLALSVCLTSANTNFSFSRLLCTDSSGLDDRWIQCHHFGCWSVGHWQNYNFLWQSD